jgi:hypothetical protein
VLTSLAFLTALAASNSDCCGIVFGDKPLGPDLAKGASVAKKNGIDRCSADARIVLGTWYDGLKRQAVEELVFLTPGHLSRWLGYGIAKGESLEGSQRMWQNFAGLAKGKTLGVVRLARLCSIDPGDMDVRVDGKPESLDTLKFRFRFVGAEWQDVPFSVIQDVQDRDPKLVWRESWDRAVSSVLLWPSKPSEYPLVSEIRWGKNRMVTALADFPIVQPGCKCEIEITEVGRQRVIPFKFPQT